MIAEVLLRCAKPMIRKTVLDVCGSWENGPRLARREADGLFRDAWTRHRAVFHALPRQPTMGGHLNVGLASLTLEFVRTLQVAGYGKSEAVPITREIAWRLYRRWASIPRAWGRLVGGSPTGRMYQMVSAFLRFPFSEPAYRWEVWERAGVVHLDVHRCPVAAFFLGEEAGDICAGTWCTLDYPLAEYWGGRYERDGTLAQGDDVCRMRWISEDAPQ